MDLFVPFEKGGIQSPRHSDEGQNPGLLSLVFPFKSFYFISQPVTFYPSLFTFCPLMSFPYVKKQVSFLLMGE
jgi:hypothetical protein